MPVVPLNTASYNDDTRRIIDAYNENFRVLDWYLNNLNQNPFISNQFDPTEILDLLKKFMSSMSPVDSHGINEAYIKYYPNKCSNSGFELFDPSTMKPYYWETDGVVSDDSNFEGTYSLKLSPGNYAIQKNDDKGIGLADPSWWSWSPDTRFSFRAKGGAMLRVSVWQNGSAVPLWIWQTKKDEKTGKEEEIKVTYTYLDTKTAVDWNLSLVTFAATPIPGGGPIQLRFDNIGESTIYIDAVTIEADWTGKHPSIYTPGPHSSPQISTEGFIEYGSADWNAGGIEFVLVNGYDYEPVVSTSVSGTPSDFSNKSFNLVVEHIKETISGAERYSKIRVTPVGDLPTPTNAKIMITAICKGAVSRT